MLLSTSVTTHGMWQEDGAQGVKQLTLQRVSYMHINAVVIVKSAPQRKAAISPLQTTLAPQHTMTESASEHLNTPQTETDVSPFQSIMALCVCMCFLHFCSSLFKPGLASNEYASALDADRSRRSRTTQYNTMLCEKEQTRNKWYRCGNCQREASCRSSG